MFERVKIWYYRRKFNQEMALRIVLAERELERLLREAQVSREQIAKVWALPSSVWVEKLRLIRMEHMIIHARDEAVKAITRKNRLLYWIGELRKHSPDHESLPDLNRQLSDATEEVEVMKRDVKRMEAILRERHWAFSLILTKAKVAELYEIDTGSGAPPAAIDP